MTSPASGSRTRTARSLTRVRFVEATVGELYIQYWLRGPGGPENAVGAIARSVGRLGRVDRNRIELWNGPRHRIIDCRRLVITWDHERNRVDVSFPSRCLAKGNFGALRVRVIVEYGGIDMDVAPKTADGEWRWTRWIRRG